MSGHLNVDLLAGQRRLFHLSICNSDDTGEHQVRIGVLVIDDEKTASGRSL